MSTEVPSTIEPTANNAPYFEEGESSVVVLRCKGEEWNRVEKEVHLAEDQLLLCYQQLYFQELFFGVKGKAIEESVNLELGLGVGEGGCCSERAVSIGNYYLGLKKKDEKTRKQKTNTPTAVVGQNILEADEVTDPLVSTDAGDSSIVVLRCKDQLWNSVELLSARYEALESEIGNLEAQVFGAEIQLGVALTEFEKTRYTMKSDQESAVKEKVVDDGGIEGIKSVQESCLVVDDGGIIDDSLNLELGLIVGEGGCSLGAYGSYFIALNKRKFEDNSRKQNFKSTTDDKTANEDISGILVATATASVPMVPVPRGTHYFARRLQEASQQTSEGKDE
ncbi:hypothetical protein CTI12_AA057000 [Artemisia annua]|uniref:Uncharacterized protein n=1 Tax=Artemisia annua TaxID=35608 RepID=A0A2U1Q6B1_ARTAN|nr:hypothetical protein CTI12_AA057000 [Artemisia annua]